MQFQSDILNKPLHRPAITETTALGAACLAGLAVGMWKDRSELRQRRLLSQNYEPHMDQARRETLLRGWHKAVGRSLDWEEHT